MMHSTPNVALLPPFRRFQHFQGFQHPHTPISPYPVGRPQSYHMNDHFPYLNSNGVDESHQDIQIRDQYGHSRESASTPEMCSMNGNHMQNGVNGGKSRSYQTSPTDPTIYDDDTFNDDSEGEMQMIENATKQKLVHDQAMIFKHLEENKIEVQLNKEVKEKESLPDEKLLHEQEMILKQIEAERQRKLKEEQLSLALIEQLSREESQGSLSQLSNARDNGAGYGSLSNSVEEFPTLQQSGTVNGWTKVTKPEKTKISSNKERKTSLQVAAEMERKQKDAIMISKWREESRAREDEEVNKMLKNIEESTKLRLIKEVGGQAEDNGQVRAGCLSAAPLAHVGINSSSSVKQKANKKVRARTNGEKAATGMNEFESERKRAALELKQRLEAQERERREKVQRESLSKEWDSAVRRCGTKTNMNEIRT